LSLIGELVSPQRLSARWWQWLSIGITASTGTTALSLLLLIRAPHIIKLPKIHQPGVSSDILGRAVRMLLQLMALQVHLVLEYHKLLVQTLLVQTEEVVFLEMAFKGLVINVVLLLAVVGATVTDMAAFMLLTTMGI
jgi:hypothetical protein